MSKGTGHVSLRIDSKLIGAVGEEAAKMDPPLSKSDFIKLCICEHLDKINRSRKSKPMVTWMTRFFDEWHNPDWER